MAVRSDRFIYLRVPKTGSSSTHDIFITQENAKIIGWSHMQYVDLTPELIGNRSIIGTVRNPFSWYYSWYIHAMSLGEPFTSMVAQYGNGRKDFRSALYGITHQWEIEYIPVPVGVFWNCENNYGTEAFRRRRIGLCTFAHDYTIGTKERYYGNGGKWGADIVIPTDRLIEGLAAVLGYEIQGQFVKPRNIAGTVKGGQPVKTNIEDIYDEEMIRWVNAADAEFIEEFEFKPFIKTPWIFMTFNSQNSD